MSTRAEKTERVRTYRNFIGGDWVEADASRTVPNLNPADTREVMGWIPLSSAEDGKRAVAAAKAAFPAWRDTPSPVRGRILFEAWRIMEAEQEQLARGLTREEGKTVKEALGEIKRTINVLEYMAGEGRRMPGETLPSELSRNFCYTVRQPLGVIACITPWNFPLCIPVWKIAPALVAGNTVVFKPATLTPDTSCALVEIFERAGLPRGVLNMVIGSGSAVGNTLLEHPDVRGVSFTGSNDVGSQVYGKAALRMVRAQCEMGGKNPLVVLADADLDAAADAAALGAFGSTGQRCTATSRVIVEDEVADEMVELLAERAQRLKVGNGLTPGIDMGPAVDKTQLETDLRYIGIGREEGAILVCGGGRLQEGDHEHGYFLEPTVFDHVTTSMRVAQEEIFGPVVSVIRVRDFEEALEAANSVRYGLSSAIYTSDSTTAFRFVDGIEAGIVHINSGTPGGEAQLPFGGMKDTGVGPREQGSAAIDFFTEVKSVYVDYTGGTRKAGFY